MTSVSDLTAPTKRLSLRALILTSAFALGVNIVWLSYNIFILPVQVQAVTTEATKGIVLGALVGAAIGVAVIVNISAGISSDHTNGRFGRRRPMLVWGTLLTLPFVLLPVFFPLTLPLVAIQYLGMQIFTNVASGAWQPTLADFVPEQQRGVSAGIKGVFTLLGSAVGVGVITELFALNLQSFAYILIVVLFALMTLINVLGMWRYDRPLPDAQPIKLWRAIRETFRVEKRAGMS
ncbi:MAG: MFS transporter, partial [Ktedonobacteraceae bacterium]